MTRLNEIRDAELAARDAAIRRWIERTGKREQNRANIAARGPEAADTPQRVAQFRARQAGIENYRRLRAAGSLALGVERMMGPTLDYVPFAPSEAARKAGRPVARIVELGGPGIEPEGIATGFLITPRLLITNHHVFPTRAYATGTGANFLYEFSDRGQQRGIVFDLDPELFFLADEALDFAIVGVAARSDDGRTLDDLGVIPLIESTGKILVGHAVNIIQHPEGGPKQYAVSQNRLVDVLDAGFLHYETDTLRGSSGSPAFSASWELVALHHASIPEIRDGRPIARNGQPWDEEMGDDEVRWIANEGVRVSTIVGKLATITMESPSQDAILRALVAGARATATNFPETVPATATNVHDKPVLFPSGVPTMSGINFNFTGPVTINVQAPAMPQPQVADIGKAITVAVEKVIRFDPDYKNREGYDPKFLGDDIVVPVPTVKKSRHDELLRDAKDRPLVLKYHHFELVMNAERRLQMWSAVNVDYDPAKKSTRDRKEFGTDKWIPDKRIAADLQIFDADFYKPAGNIDRGHIVRREDNAWGDTEEEIEFANSDTFHWTNCTPQHEAFNQSTPGRNDKTYKGMVGIWGDFENYIQQSRKNQDTKACILAGPVLNDKDPAADFGNGSIQYPLRFWKVVCIADADDNGDPELKVYGFILDQSDVVDKFGIEKFTVGRFKDCHYSLDAITGETGVVFDKVLHDADTKGAER